MTAEDSNKNNDRNEDNKAANEDEPRLEHRQSRVLTNSANTVDNRLKHEIAVLTQLVYRLRDLEWCGVQFCW